MHDLRRRTGPAVRAGAGAGLMLPSMVIACQRQNIATVHTLRELSATPAR